MKVKELFQIRKIIPLMITAAGIWLALRFSKECSRGIFNGILFCVEVLVPSLFAFMVIAAYAVKSGAAAALTKHTGGLTQAIFGLPSPALSVIILSMIGGYPVGARCSEMMYEEGQLTAKQAEKAVYIAVCAGPGFLINFVGSALLGSPDAGILLLCAEIISVILTGVVIGRTVKCDCEEVYTVKKEKQSNLLVASVGDASSATFRMCSMVIICSALIEIISSVSPEKALTDISAAVIEITTGCGIMCKKYPLALTAFFIGFGGISVHLQIFAALDKVRINKALFFLFRIIQGIICMGATYILLMIFPLEVSVFNSAEVGLTAAKSATLVGSAALVLCSLCFLGTVNKLILISNKTH